MSFTWDPDLEPPKTKIGAAGWVRVFLRGVPLIFILVVGVVLMGGIRLLERPLFGLARPWTPVITVMVSRLALRILGLRRQTVGAPMKARGALVANHASWLDIFTLNAGGRLYFVSKAEVAGWPGIGLLAKITGTVFIARDRTQAKAQQTIFETRLKAGHRLLFFPEGTSTDGFRVLPFKTTLFQAFFQDGLRDEMCIQPVSVCYNAPIGTDPRFFGWWGDMDFGPHLLRILAGPGKGVVRVVYHAPVAVREMTDRKALALAVEQATRSGMPAERQGKG